MRSESKVEPGAKVHLRREMRQRLKTLPQSYRVEASRQACALLREQRDWRQSKSVLCYAPLPGELDIWPLLGEALACGKQLLLPRFEPELDAYSACVVANLENDVVSGRYGIREPGRHCPPRPLNGLDFVLVPGLAFDLHGRRLGRGKGFYDRLLPAVCGMKCGVGFDEQLLAEVPAEPHDILLNRILTPTRWIEL